MKEQLNTNQTLERKLENSFEDKHPENDVIPLSEEDDPDYDDDPNYDHPYDGVPGVDGNLNGMWLPNSHHLRQQQ